MAGHYGHHGATSMYFIFFTEPSVCLEGRDGLTQQVIESDILRLSLLIFVFLKYPIKLNQFRVASKQGCPGFDPSTCGLGLTVWSSLMLVISLQFLG